MFNGRVYKQQSCRDWPAKRNKPVYTPFPFLLTVRDRGESFTSAAQGGDSLIQPSSTDRLLSGGYPRLTIPRKKAPPST